jgi:hypothetical protein
MRLWAALTAAVLLAGGAHAADVVSERPRSAAVTIYNLGENTEGLALITETRTVDLPAGPATVRFRGVVSTIVPQTAKIEGLGAPVSEANFDYDLLTPASLITRSVGRRVRLVRTNSTTGAVSDEQAVIRAATSEGVVLQLEATGEGLRCSGLPERLVFDSVPEGLSDTPTLSVRTVSPSAGRRTLTLSYLATGLAWKADYVARLAPDRRSLDLSGSVTLTNSTATSLDRAPTQLVAGELALTGEDRPVQPPWVYVPTGNCWPITEDYGDEDDFGGGPPPPPPPPPAPMMEAMSAPAMMKRIEPENLGDYKLYTLPEPTDVKARSTKQVQFIDLPGAAVEPIYTYRVYFDGPDPARADVESWLRFKNTKANRLGQPLPAGSIAVTAPDARGGQVFLGEGKIVNTPIGSPFEVRLGGALDLTVVPRSVRVWEQRKRQYGEVEVTASNAKSVAVDIEVFHADECRTFKVVHGTRPTTQRLGSPAWRLHVPANGTSTLRYTVECRD